MTNNRHLSPALGTTPCITRASSQMRRGLRLFLLTNLFSIDSSKVASKSQLSWHSCPRIALYHLIGCHFTFYPWISQTSHVRLRMSHMYHTSHDRRLHPCHSHISFTTLSFSALNNVVKAHLLLLSAQAQSVHFRPHQFSKQNVDTSYGYFPDTIA